MMRRALDFSEINAVALPAGSSPAPVASLTEYVLSVVALTEATAAIEKPVTGTITTYRRLCRQATAAPALTGLRK
jgi:hypothetical protein